VDAAAHDEPRPVLQFLNHKVGRTPWARDQPASRPILHRKTQTWNKRRQTSMPQLGFQPTTPVFEQVKTVHALDNAATVIGN
jgi:hypothetical protein